MISLDEQIAYAKSWYADNKFNEAILATLQSIKSQPVPVEPDYWNKLAKEHYWENEAKRYAGNAEYWRDRAEKAEQERDKDISPCCQDWHTCQRRCAPLAENWRMAAKQAEASNKRLAELLQRAIGSIGSFDRGLQSHYERLLREVGNG